MRQKYKNPILLARLRVKGSKRKKALIINKICICNSNEIYKEEWVNSEGTLTFFYITNILSTAKGLFEFLTSSELVKRYSAFRVTKLDGRLLFDSMVINDMVGYCKALTEFESQYNKILRQ